MMERNLNVTLAHEFYRCSKAYRNFNLLRVVLTKESNVESRLNCYNSYVDFLAHFYEFYIGNIEHNIKPESNKFHELYNSDSKKKKHEIIDYIINLEVEKLLRNRKARIIAGFNDDLGLDLKFYEIKVPVDFGKHFRFVRHRRNHTDPNRADSEGNISLTTFYKLYHRFLIIMFQETEWIWKVDVEKFDWKAINSFTQEILS